MSDQMSVTVVEITGTETPEQTKRIAWRMFCNAHPIEAYQHDPDGFWEFFHELNPTLTREHMVALLKECEESQEDED